MTQAYGKIGWFLRGALASVLFMAVAFLSMFSVAALATGTKDGGWFTEPVFLAWLVLSYLAIGYAFYGSRNVIRWVALLVPFIGLVLPYA